MEGFDPHNVRGRSLCVIGLDPLNVGIGVLCGVGFETQNLRSRRLLVTHVDAMNVGDLCVITYRA